MASRRSNTSTKASAKSAGQRITERIEDLNDWRGKRLARIRTLIHQADPDVVEEWKWDTPVWSHNGILCTGESYKQVVKLTFPKGAALKDPKKLFNSSLDGNVRRAIDISEKEKFNESAFKELIRAAVSLNGEPRLLAGGNPQMAKADGNAPVQTYIAAMPGWKRDIGRRLDALIVRAVPHVRKAVKWNSPFYGIEGQGWFLAFHVFTRFVKVTFFRGTSLQPAPTGGTGKDARWIDIHEADFNEAQLTKWVKQAAKLPGWGKG